MNKTPKCNEASPPLLVCNQFATMRLVSRSARGRGVKGAAGHRSSSTSIGQADQRTTTLRRRWRCVGAPAAVRTTEGRRASVTVLRGERGSPTTQRPARGPRPVVRLCPNSADSSRASRDCPSDTTLAPVDS